MEGDNFPYFFAPSCSFPLSSSFNNDSTSDVLEPTMQQNNPHHQFSSSDQIDLASLLSAGPLDQRPISRNNNIMSEGDHHHHQNGSSRNNNNKNNNNNSNNNKSWSRIGKKKKYIPPRVAFHTRSAEDILDDGYKWRKYGQKSVKNSVHPRSYYRCTHHTCNVKKQIQRLSKDTGIVVTTYEGIHNHPCEKLMETLSPILKQLQFLSRF